MEVPADYAVVVEAWSRASRVRVLSALCVWGACIGVIGLLMMFGFWGVGLFWAGTVVCGLTLWHLYLEWQ